MITDELMKQQLLGMHYDVVRPEYAYGDSRFDFYMERDREKYRMPDMTR